MSSIAIGHFSRVPDYIFGSDLSPRQQQVWGVMAGWCTPENPFAHLQHKKCAEILHCSTDTIARAINGIVAKGMAVFTGEKKYGIFKIYRLIWAPEEKNLDQPRKSADSNSADLPTPSPQNCPPIIEEQLENNIQQAPERCETKTPVVVSNLDSKAIEGLIEKGVKKNAAKRLVKKHGAEACLKQIEHLESKLSGYAAIRNQAGWLRKAINDDYAFTKEKAALPAMSLEERRRLNNKERSQKEVEEKREAYQRRLESMSSKEIKLVKSEAKKQAQRDYRFSRGIFGVTVESLMHMHFESLIRRFKNTACNA